MFFHKIFQTFIATIEVIGIRLSRIANQTTYLWGEFRLRPRLLRTGRTNLTLTLSYNFIRQILITTTVHIRYSFIYQIKNRRVVKQVHRFLTRHTEALRQQFYDSRIFHI